MAESVEMLRGSLDLLMLKALSWGPAHGYAVARWIASTTGRALVIEEGSLYPALHRLEDRGLVGSSWGLSANNRRAKYYVLTAAGRRRLAADSRDWSLFAKAVSAALDARSGPVAEGAPA